MAQYVSVAQIGSDVFFIMLNHTSKFEITILFHTSPAKGIIKRRLIIISDEQEYGQDMCKVTDTSSCIHSLRHHRVIKDIGNVWRIKLLHKTEAFQDTLSKLGDTQEVPAMLDEEECGGSSCSNPVGEMWWPKWCHNLELNVYLSLPIYHNWEYLKWLLDVNKHYLWQTTIPVDGHWFLPM